MPVGKNFKRISINSKKFIFSPHHLFFTTHSTFGAILDQELQLSISGDRSNKITNHKGQVDPRFIPYIFNVFISIFHGVIFYLEPFKNGYPIPRESQSIESRITLGIRGIEKPSRVYVQM